MPQHFSKLVTTDYGSLNFYFNSINIAGEMCYHISTVNKQGRSVYLLMENRIGRWVLQSPESYPDWIVRLEEIFNQIIQKKIKAA
jgi:hypothetical protein